MDSKVQELSGDVQELSDELLGEISGGRGGLLSNMGRVLVGGEIEDEELTDAQAADNAPTIQTAAATMVSANSGSKIRTL